MTAVAAATVLDQAVARLSEDAFTFLCDVHNSEIDEVLATADVHLHKLREFARMTGAPLDELPAYHAHITSWRAVARLAGATIDMRSQAG